MMTIDEEHAGGGGGGRGGVITVTVMPIPTRTIFLIQRFVSGASMGDTWREGAPGIN